MGLGKRDMSMHSIVSWSLQSSGNLDLYYLQLYQDQSHPKAHQEEGGI